MPMRMTVLGAMLLLTGCLAQPRIYNSDPDVITQVPATHGVVIFQAVTMDSRVHPYMPGWHIMRSTRIGGPPITWLKEGEQEPLKYHIYPDYRVIPGTSFWIGVLPAGNYLAEDFYTSFHNGQYYGHLAVPVIDAYASFRIEPGRVTVLDTYLYEGLGQNHLLGNVSSRVDLLRKAAEAYPGIMAGVDATDPIRFPARDSEDEAQTLELLLPWARTTEMTQHAPDGYSYRAARAGQIFERTPSGEWRRVSLGTFEPVDSIQVRAGGEVYAVTSGGRAFHRERFDAPFTELPLNFQGRLRNLIPLDDGRWLAAVRHTQTHTEQYGRREEKVETYELEILLANDLAGPWQSFARMPVERIYSNAQVIGSQVFIGNPRGTGASFDLANGAKTQLPTGFAFLRSYADGTVLGHTTYETGFWGTEPAEIWLSRDWGRTWEKLPNDVEPKGMPAWKGGKVMLPARRAHRTREERARGAENFVGIVAAAPGDRTWQAVDTVPEDCTGWAELQYSDDEVVLFCEYAVFRKNSALKDWFNENMRGFKRDEDAEL